MEFEFRAAQAGVPVRGNDGDIIRFNSGTGKWETVTPAGVGVEPLTLTFYVDAGFIGTSNGSIAAPFATIQAAATALGDSDGTLFVVPKGDATSYGEDVTVGAGAVAIVGTRPDIINPARTRSITSTGFLHVENFEVEEGVTASAGGTSGKNSNLNGEPAIASAGAVSLVECDAEAIEAVGDVSCLNCDLELHVDTDARFYVCGRRTPDGGALGGASCLELVAQDTTLDGEFQQQGASGGGGPHANPDWNLQGVRFGSSASLLGQGGGQSLFVYVDDPSVRSLYQQGVTILGVNALLEASSVGPVEIHATEALNTSATSGDALFHIVSGNSFAGGGDPFTLTPEGGILTYGAAFASGGAPTPSLAMLVTLTCTISANAGVAYCGIAVDQDLVGDDPTAAPFTDGVGEVEILTNDDRVSMTCTRVITLPSAATETDIQPVFALSAADDIAIERLSMSVAPLTFALSQF